MTDIDPMQDAAPTDGTYREAVLRGAPDGSRFSDLKSAGLEAARAEARLIRRWADRQASTASQALRDDPVRGGAALFGLGLILGLYLARR